MREFLDRFSFGRMPPRFLEARAEVRSKMLGTNFFRSNSQCLSRFCLGDVLAVTLDVYTIVIVTHSLQQAARASDFTTVLC